MNILYIADNYYPEITPGAFRPTEHSEAWVQSGDAVTVITCIPNFPRGVPYKGYEGDSTRDEVINGVEVKRVRTYMAPNAGFFKRILDFLSFAVSASLHGRAMKPDIIVSSSPPLFTCLAASILSSRNNVPWVLEIRDLWPESIKDVGLMKSGFFYRMLERLELYFYRKATHIVCVSPGFVKDLESRGIDANKITWIPNGASIKLKKNESLPEPHKTVLSDLQKKPLFLVGYVGRIGMAHGLELLIEVAKNLKDEPFHFLLVGEGSEEDDLKKRAASANLTNITFLPAIAKEQVDAIYSYLDAGIIHQRKGETFRKNIPSKLFDLAAAGVPIISGVDGETRTLIDAHKCGLYFEPEDAEGCVGVLRKLQSEPETQASLSENAKFFSAKFSREAQANKMRTLLHRICE